MSEIKYVSLANLQAFSTKEHKYEKLVLKAKDTPNDGMYASIDVFQGVDDAGAPAKTAIGTIDIPLDKYVTGGEIRVVEKTATDPAKCYIDLTLANQTDKVSIDISSVSGDVADVKAAIDKLNGTVSTEGSVLYMIQQNAVNAIYKAESASGAGDGETIKEALDRLDKDLTYKGTTTAAVTGASEGDLYYFNIAETSEGAGDAVVGWKFWSTKDVAAGEWKELSDATLATRVSELETQVGKDKDVTAYQSKTDLVDIINVLTADKTNAGSVAEVVYDNAKDAKSGSTKIDHYELISDPTQTITVEAYEALSDEDKAKYKAIDVNMTIQEAIADAKAGAEDAIKALDVDDTALATAADGVVTIKAVKEVDGKIAASTDTTLDVTLAKVATTGSATDVAVTAASGEASEGQAAWSVAAGSTQTTVETLAKADANMQAAINTLNAVDTVEGSVLKTVKDKAKDGTYSSKTTNYYLWASKQTSLSYATTSETPNVGDILYVHSGDLPVLTEKTVEAFDATANTITVDGVAYARTTVGDFTYTKITTIEQAIKDAASGSTEASKVTVEKLATPTTGYSASYVVKQNDEQVGATIDIPKDFLVKSGKIVRYVLDASTGKYYDEINDPEKKAEIDNLPEGVSADKDYLDFVVNAKDESATEQHIYIDVTHLCNVYTGKSVENGVSVSVSDDYEISAEIKGKAVARANVDDDFEADLTAIEGAFDKNEDGTLKSVKDTIKMRARLAGYEFIGYALTATDASATYQNVGIIDMATTNVGSKVYIDDPSTTDTRAKEAGTITAIDGTPGSKGCTWTVTFADSTTADYVYQGSEAFSGYYVSTIKEEIDALKEASSDTNGAFVYKGTVATLPTTANKGDAYLLTTTNTLYICTTASTTSPAADAVFTQIADNGEFTVGNDTLSHSVSIKDYIDSRIFIGTQDEVDAAKTAGTIDDTCFCIITDSESQELVPVTDQEISDLFD